MPFISCSKINVNEYFVTILPLSMSIDCFNFFFFFHLFFLTVAFQVLDTDNDGYLSYHELFSLFRMVTGPSMTDDQVLSTITSILNMSDLQQASRLTFEEFVNVRIIIRILVLKG